MKKKRSKGIWILLILLAVAAGGMAVSRRLLPKEGEAAADNYKTETVRRGTVATGVSESGTAELGTTEQVFSVAEVTDVTLTETDTESDSAQASAGGGSGMDMTGGMAAQNQGGSMGMTSASGTSESSGEETSLEVEEVYASAGQVLKEGDKILKITEDSIETYRAQLEAAVESAQLSVSQEEINVETKKAEADYTYQMYLAEGETAQETYDATITSLENAVADLEEELEDTDDEDEMEELEAELKIAQNNLSTGTIEAKQTYDKAMTNYKYAEQLYEIDTNGLEDDLNDAKDTLEEAQANLEEFEEQIGDGIVYAQYAGTVTEIAYAAGDAIINEAAVVTVTNAEEVTMTVSVSQDDISQISVGDAAQITLTAYENEEFEGEVSGISTSATTGSSTVNYDVSVRFTGDTSKVYSGMTGEVTFAGTTVSDTLYISNRAVQMDGARSYVKVLEEDGAIQETDIKTGFSNGTFVAVESGLEEGQTVVIESKVAQ